MKRRISVIVVVGLRLTGLGATSAGASPGRPGEAEPPPAPTGAGDTLDVYTGTIDAEALGTLRESGVDPHDLAVTTAPDGSAEVEVVLSGEQAGELAEEGVALEPKLVDGVTTSQAATLAAQDGHAVYRTYGGAGGLKEEFEQIAADHPDITKLVTIGQSVQGQDIVALKVTRRATHVRDGRRPSTLFSAAQHAREWITPEMVRRLAHHVVDGYGTDQALTDLVDTTELWFVPVANPDGYDFTFEPGNRDWRKNLRDNNEDGQITVGDGVDPNRNFPTKWNYDDEGSSSDPGSETYRGPAPASEPETRALDGLMERVGFEFQINYHSAAELLLYGTGWQVATPTPDDVVYEAMAGTDANPAVPGYDPDISAELYTTNGETTEHAHRTYGTLAFTPEMSTCETVSEADPADEWEPEDCGSVFTFPDDEELIQAEFLKNVPFAIATAQAARDPEDFLTDTYLFGPVPDIAVAERQQYLTMAVRDYLNEGGKLVQSGETAQYYGLLGGSVGGIYYGLDGAPEEDCVISEDFFSDCLLLADDFSQYWLGAFARTTFVGPTGIEGTGPPLEGASADFGGQAVVDNPLDEAGAFSLTSDVLPPETYPLFAGNASSTYLGAGGVNPFGPVEGERYAGAVHADGSYMRIGRTVDLTGVSAAEAPTLELALSFSTELGYDHLIIEAAPSGTDQWTTLPDLNGGTTSTPPTECEVGFLLRLHPFLNHYLTPGNPCGTTGTTGAWNSFTGESGGWVDAAFDLSAYAGQPVDVKVSYVTDPASGGIGVFVDDTRVTTTAGELDADGFETDPGLWTVEGPPPGGPPTNQGDFVISTVLVEVAASVTTEDTVLLGYGIESLATPAEQADVLGRVMDHLLAG